METSSNLVKSNLAREEGPRESFDELMDTPLDFSTFMMNRTQIIPFDNFINNDLEYLSGGVLSQTYATSVTKTKAADYGHIKWIEDLGRKRQQFYAFADNRESARDVYYKRRIIAVIKLQIFKWHGYKHLDWITLRKLTNLNVEDRLAFGVSLRMFTRSIVIQRRVEDLQLGVESYQKKLNITNPDTYRSDLKCRDAYTAYSNPRGFIYQNKDKKNKLMRIDELDKFSDGTHDDVRTALNDHMKGIMMEYLPQTIWRQSDRERAKSMIYAIDKQLKSRRIMRSLERFVGGSPYRYSNPMIQPEPEGSTQGYPLVSVEVLRFNTTAGNPVKKILLKLNLSDHRIHKDGGEDFRYFDTERLSRSDEVLKLKNFKKDGSLKLFKSTNHERYEHVCPEVTSSQDGKVNKMVKQDYAWLMILRNDSLLDVVAKEVVTYFYMFSPRVLDGVFTEVDGAFIVAHDQYVVESDVVVDRSLFHS
ncbi:hypothetical protein Tco_0792722 [Tanacetum coccineum]